MGREGGDNCHLVSFVSAPPCVGSQVKSWECLLYLVRIHIFFFIRKEITRLGVIEVHAGGVGDRGDKVTKCHR